jgi:hypothetical protein
MAHPDYQREPKKEPGQSTARSGDQLDHPSAVRGGASLAPSGVEIEKLNFNSGALCNSFELALPAIIMVLSMNKALMIANPDVAATVRTWYAYG